MKLIVAGGGAAGFFCAINAARLNPRLQVIIIEKTNKLLSKVKVSGGGRCNVTHAHDSISEMAASYPRGSRFLKKAFHHFFVPDTIEWFRTRQVELKAEADGRMFPVTDSSQTIIDCFLNEASLSHVEIMMRSEITEIENEGDKWNVRMKDKNIECDFLLIASGGFAKSEQFNWLSKTHHTVISPVPSLFTFNIPDHSLKSLMGVSSQATVKISGTKFSETGPVLITHWGFSGPAVLKLSSRAAKELHGLNYSFTISINWLPDQHEQSLIDTMQTFRSQTASQKIYNSKAFDIPSRLWHHQLHACSVNEDARWADLPAKQQNLLAKKLCADIYTVRGKTTFKEEFVTAGGISTDEVDVNSMESRLHKNLFFAGEILDIDGITGGYNFQNAWTTAMIAARTIADRTQNQKY